MKVRLAVAVAVAVFLWIAPAPPASAHRLDEFLQATMIAVARDHVSMRMRLTPGAAVSFKVFAEIDTDGDGIVSEAEQRAYGERVCRDLSLTVDAVRIPLRVVSSTFPKIEEVREGLGEILLTLEAKILPGVGPRRRLVFENHHQGEVAAYLVNCLRPDDPGIHVTGQNRNEEQSFYQLDYTISQD
jgi:hypothetical protein